MAGMQRGELSTRCSNCLQSGPLGCGGGGGIRTPETLSSLTVFKTAGFNRSPTPPFAILAYSASYRPICHILAPQYFVLPRRAAMHLLTRSPHQEERRQIADWW